MIPIEQLEFLMNRKNIELNGRHWSILMCLFRELHGWGQAEKCIPQQRMEELTGLHHSHFNVALNELIASGIINKKKVPGERSLYFTLNREVFGRVLATEEPSRVMWTGQEVPTTVTKVTNLVTFTKVPKPVTSEVTNLVTLSGTVLVTRKSRKLPKLKRNLAPIYNLKDMKDISLSEIHSFLKAAPRATKARWERLISEILLKNPKDVQLLLLAIEMVHKEKKDFMGVAIHSSIIGLFEKTEWSVMKDALLDKIKREREKRETENDVEKTRRQLQKEVEEIDVSKLSPQNRKYAIPPHKRGIQD